MLGKLPILSVITDSAPLKIELYHGDPIALAGDGVRFILSAGRVRF
jgi:hypothetical protein